MTTDSDSQETLAGARISFGGVVRAAVLAAACCVVAASLRGVQNVLAPLVAAMFFSLVIVTPIPWLSRHMPRWLAAAIVAAGTTMVFGLIVALIPRWASTLSDVVATHQTQVGGWATDLEGISGWIDIGPNAKGGGISTQWLLDASARAFRLVSGVVLVLVLLGFVVSELAGLRIKIEAALGPESAQLKLLDRVFDRLISYFLIKSVASAITGLLAGLACAWAGLPIPELWGFIAFVLNYAPTIGSFVAAVPAVLLAFLTLEWWQALILGGAYLVINIAIGSVIEPKVLGERLGLSPLVILLSLVLWGWVLGPIGLLLAVPLTMIMRLVLEQTSGLEPVAVLLGGAREARRRLDRHRQAGPKTPPS